MNPSPQDHIDSAIKEILNPTFEGTKQFLEVNEIEFENGLPKVERLDLNYSENIAAVFFPFKNRDYFLEIHLTKTPKINIHFVFTENAHRAYLTATSEELNYQELCKNLTFTPLTGWSKGDIKIGKTTRKFSRVSFEPIKVEACGLDKLLDLLLKELEKDIEGVKQLTKKLRHIFLFTKNNM